MTEALHISANSWWHHREELEQFAQSMDKSTRLALKQGGFWKISKALTTFATTIGRTVYIPADWTFDRVQRVLPHEVLGHVKQFRYCGLGIHPTLGIFPGMFFIYVLLFFPIWLAWGRYRMELHAETQAWKYRLEHDDRPGALVWIKLRSEAFPKKVGGKEYFYSVPKCWAVWGFKRRAKKVIDGYQRAAA
jgi:hypothetical protein